MSNPHLIDGEFQSDKYPTTPRGKVPLSVKDPMAQDLLWEYAQRRRAVDADFSAALETALRANGHEPRTDGKRLALWSWDDGDWFWDYDNPDGSGGDHPDEVLTDHEGEIVNVESSIRLGDRYGFQLDAAADATTDDAFIRWHNSSEEAQATMATELARRAALPAKEES